MKKQSFLQVVIFIGVSLFLYPSTPYALPGNKIILADYKIGYKTEIVKIHTANRPNFNTVVLENPQRLIFNLKDTFLPEVHLSKNVDSQTINGFRISQNTRNLTRLVIDFKGKPQYRTEISKLDDNNFSLDIEIKKPYKKNNPSLGSKPSTIIPVLNTWSDLSQSFMRQEEMPGQADKTPPELNFSSIRETKPIASDTEDPSSAPLEKPVLRSSFSLLEEGSLPSDLFDETSPQKKSDWKPAGSFLVRTSIDTKNDQPNENQTSLKTRAILKLEYKNSFLISGISDYLYFGSNNRTDDHDLDLFETYFKTSFSKFDLSIGKQIKRWGKTDQISPIDTLNPENITEFVIPSYEERKIPIWMADLTFKQDHFFIESIFIPFFEPAKFDYFGTDWAHFSHIKSDLNDSNLPNALKSYFNAISVDEDEPARDADGFEYAARFGGTVHNIDVGFTYHYAFEDLPTIQRFPIKNLALENPNSIDGLLSHLDQLILTNEAIDATFLRTHIFGFEFETTVNKVGFRGEAVFKENESYLTQSFTSVRNPTAFWIVGMDYTTLNEWYFNLQFGHQHIFQFDPSTLFFEKDNYSLIGEINRDLFFDWLKGTIQYTYIINDSSYYISPRVTYSYIDNWQFLLGANLFEGSSDTIFGRYNRNDQLFFSVKFKF